MRLIFSRTGWDDYVSWQTADRKMLARVNNLIQACQADPEDGIGKPEPLTGELWTGWWSRRINDEHRLIYRVTEDDDLEIAAARLHYRK